MSDRDTFPFVPPDRPKVRDLEDDTDAVEYPEPRRPARGDLEEYGERPSWRDL